MTVAPQNIAETVPSKVTVRQLVLALHRLASAMSESTIFLDRGVGLAEWTLLEEIGDQPIRMTDLSRKTRLSRQRTTIIVKELQRKGLLGVAPLPLSDRRSRLIVITPVGKETLSIIARYLETLDLSGQARGLSPALRLTRVLLRALRTIRHRTDTHNRASRLPTEIVDDGRSSRQAEKHHVSSDS